MSTTLSLPRRRAAIAAVGAVAAVLATSAITAAPALADDPSTLTVVGTSDVFDSNLVQSVIKPGFEAQFPGVTLNYVSKGTGAAIAYAEAGSASALIVHAPSLENQFVASGYSNEPYGRAIFWGDYVILGPKSDPLNIAKVDAHNAAGAFERIAQYGARGKANFVSRGGTPGTTVQEHAIWALTNGVPTCTVTDVNGGGQAPSTTSVGSTCPVQPTNPSWYHTTGLTQGPNVQAADTCNFNGGNCYVLTDRGTFNYLDSIGSINNLKIVTRDNGAQARGGVPLLVNSFHAYAVNPATVPSGSALNVTGAENFLNWITSPDAQTAIGNYLNATNDPPFIPDAAPRVTTSALPATVSGNKTISLQGTVSNVVPGTPALANQTVKLFGTDNEDTPVTTLVATTTTNSLGKYTFKFIPKVSSTYSVRVPDLTQIEYPDLNPVFGDMLEGTSAAPGGIAVIGAPTITSAAALKGALRIGGRLAPAPADGNAEVTVLASKDGGDEMPLGTIPVSAGQVTFSQKFMVPSGSYTYRVTYRDQPYISLGSSDTRTTVVP